MPPTRPQKRYRCRFCGLILNAWLPVFRAPDGALLLTHLTQHHRAEARATMARLRDTTEEIATVAAEAFEVIECVDLIDRYAQAEGVELKDVVNLAFHEFFERRQYLPPDALRREP